MKTTAKKINDRKVVYKDKSNRYVHVKYVYNDYSDLAAKYGC